MELRPLFHLIRYKGMKKFITTEQLPNILAALQEGFIENTSFNCNISLAQNEGLPILVVDITKQEGNSSCETIVHRIYNIVPPPMDEYDVLNETFGVIEDKQ